MLGVLDAILAEKRRTLAFPKWLEIKYDEESGARQSRAMMRAIPGLIIVYNLFILADVLIVPDMLRLAMFLHLAVVTPGMLIVMYALGRLPNRLWRDVLGTLPSLMMVGQIIAIYVISSAPDSAHYLYFILMVAICSNTSAPLSHRSANWLSWATCLALAATLILTRRLPVGVGVMQTITLVIVAFVTLNSNFLRNRHLRRAYVIDLRNRLRVEAMGQEARHDALTGLSNRRRLDEAAGELWARGDSAVSPVSVILFDVDRFKAFNDIYGHQAGDACLREIAGRAPAEAGGADDVAARYGGEEFMVLLPRTNLEEAREAAERLRRAILALAIPHEGAELGLATASFGVASADVSDCSFAALTQAADAALYASKRAGRNRVSAATLLEPAPRSHAA